MTGPGTPPLARVALEGEQQLRACLTVSVNYDLRPTVTVRSNYSIRDLQYGIRANSSSDSSWYNGKKYKK